MGNYLTNATSRARFDTRSIFKRGTGNLRLVYVLTAFRDPTMFLLRRAVSQKTVSQKTKREKKENRKEDLKNFTCSHDSVCVCVCVCVILWTFLLGLSLPAMCSIRIQHCHIIADPSSTRGVSRLWVHLRSISLTIFAFLTTLVYIQGWIFPTSGLLATHRPGIQLLPDWIFPGHPKKCENKIEVF